MKKKICTILCLMLFVAGNAFLMFSRGMVSHTNEDYRTLQPEYTGPDVIDRVLYHEDLQRLYVCYNDARYVDVYDTQGRFQWAVATPYLHDTHFLLEEDRLLIYYQEAYLYDATTGAFLGLAEESALDLPADVYDLPGTDTPAPGDDVYDAHQVYRIEADGQQTVLIARPMWHRLLHPGPGIAVALCGILGLGLMLLLDKIRFRLSGGLLIPLTHPTARWCFRYFRVTTYVHLAYTGLNLLTGCFGGFLCIGIFPLAIHQILLLTLTERKLNRAGLSRPQTEAVDYWRFMAIASFLAAFFSCILVASIFSA